MPLPATSSNEGPTPYSRWRDRQNVPVVTGNYVEDDLKLPVKNWEEWGDGVRGCILNLAEQQVTDQHVIEIAPDAQTLPRHHIYESLFHVRKGSGRTEMWQGDGAHKLSFEWRAGSLFSVPINFSYQLFCTSKDEGARMVIGNSLPMFLNYFRSEDFVWKNQWAFKDRYTRYPSFFEANEWTRYNNHTKHRATECNIIPDVNSAPLDEWAERGPGIKIMRYAMCDNTIGCHIQEIPVASRTTVHRHDPGAAVHVTEGEGFCVLFFEGEKFVPYEIHAGSIFSPRSQQYHGHFNTGNSTMRHVAYRGRLGGLFGSPNYDFPVVRQPENIMLTYDEEPKELMQYYLSELKKNGITKPFQMVKE
jgi:quercetin dioxygenase-like cupin family protein